MSIKADLDEDARSRIENALYELQSMDGKIGWIINKLVVTQPDILTLVPRHPDGRARQFAASDPCLFQGQCAAERSAGISFAWVSAR